MRCVLRGLRKVDPEKQKGLPRGNPKGLVWRSGCRVELPGATPTSFLRIVRPDRMVSFRGRDEPELLFHATVCPV